jgi:hypothetical protein
LLYDLTAVVLHSGNSGGSGHYISLVRDQLGEGAWDAAAVASQHAPNAHDPGVLGGGADNNWTLAAALAGVAGGNPSNRNTDSTNSGNGSGNGDGNGSSSNGSRIAHVESKEAMAALEPGQLLRRLLAARAPRDERLQGCKSAPLDDLSAWVRDACRTGDTWRSLHLKRHGKLSAFVQSRPDDFLWDPGATTVSLLDRDGVDDLAPLVLGGGCGGGARATSPDDGKAIARLLADDSAFAALAAVLPTLAASTTYSMSGDGSGGSSGRSVSGGGGSAGDGDWVAPKRKGRGGAGNSSSSAVAEGEAALAAAASAAYARMEALGAARWGRWFCFDDSSVRAAVRE